MYVRLLSSTETSNQIIYLDEQAYNDWYKTNRISN